MIRLVCLLLLVLAGPVAAQDLPALYNVRGVAENDVLNIRAAPDATAPILGSYPHNRRGIEVLSLDPAGDWALVNVDEATGWVATAFLRPQFPGTSPLPAKFTCFGTEPFWRLDITQNDQSYFAEPMEDPMAFATGPLITGAGRTDIYAITALGLSTVVQRAECNDGMSDRQYGLSVSMVINRDRLYSGCCTLEH